MPSSSTTNTLPVSKNSNVATTAVPNVKQPRCQLAKAPNPDNKRSLHAKQDSTATAVTQWTASERTSQAAEQRNLSSRDHKPPLSWSTVAI
jgi:hypothetical protein